MMDSTISSNKPPANICNINLHIFICVVGG